MDAVALSTIVVYPIEGYNILRMVWGQQVNPNDVSGAFHTVTSFMDKSLQPVHIIVDIQQNPKFPLQTTISSTLIGPFSHAQMGKWLVVGSNRMAKMIASVLTQVGNRNNILWFDDEASLWAYIAELD